MSGSEHARVDESPDQSVRLKWSSHDWLMVGAIGLMAFLAWGMTVMMADRSTPFMPGMTMEPSPAASALRLVTPPAVLFFLAMWVIMMVAMMFPSIWPVVLLYHRAASRTSRVVQSGVGQRTVATGLFLVGYLIVWGGSGLAAFAGQIGAPVGLAWGGVTPEWNWRLGGVVFILAGLYQLTPLKARCLTHCQSPFGFIMHHWREGRWGALRMGMTHGLYCLGCCWALMVLLVTVGMMNLHWMAGLAGLILFEKLSRWETLIPRVSGLLLLGTGLAILIQPVIFVWLSQ